MQTPSISSKGAALLAAPFLLSPCTAIAQEASEPANTAPVLQASSNWALDYSADSCRVGRFFGDEDNLTVLQLTQFEPDHRFMLVVAGPSLGKRPRLDKATIQFGPVHAPRDDLTPTGGTVGEFEPALIYSEASVRKTEQYPGSTEDEDQTAITTFVSRDAITLDDEALVEWIEVAFRGKPRVRLATGPMKDLFKALNTCSEELLTHWGLDLERHRTMSIKPIPLAPPSRWIESEDYPDAELRKGEQAIIYFRLMVGEDGVPDACHIQQSGYSEAFDKAVCDNLMENARFTAARDGEGKSMRSYYRTAVRFQIGW